MMRRRTRNKQDDFFEKAAAIGLSICLLVTSGTGYAAAPSAAPAVSVSKQSLEVSIPVELGKIEEVYQGASAKTIIYIQDAHDSLEAQKNIARTIHYLVDQYGVKTVYEEGYEGAVPTDKYFGTIQDSKIRRRVAFFLMDKLRLGGAEYAHITRKKDFQLIGADSFKLHKENIEKYQASAKHRTEIENDLGEMDAAIRKLAQRYFTKDLKEWMEIKERLDRGQLDLLNYLKRLNKLKLRSSIETAAEQRVQYPLIDLLLVSEKSKSPEALAKVPLMDAAMLFGEVNRLEEAYARDHLKRSRDRQVFSYYKLIQLLKRLSVMQVTEEEYAAVKDNLGTLETQKIAQFLALQSGKSIVLSKTWEAHIRSAIEFYEIAKQRDEVIEKTITSVEQIAVNGEEKKNSHISALNAESSLQTASILVYGGFHKEAIKSMLRRNGFSYVVVSPKMTRISVKHQDYYKQLMRMGFDSMTLPKLVARATTAPRLLEFARNSKSEVRLIDQINSLAQLAELGRTLPEMDLDLSRNQGVRKRISTAQRSEVRTETAPDSLELDHESLSRGWIRAYPGLTLYSWQATSRAQVSTALGRIKETSVPILLEVISSENQLGGDARLLEGLLAEVHNLNGIDGKKQAQVNTLLTSLQSEKNEERREALQALTKLGPVAFEALPALIKEADENPELRNDIVLAVDAITLNPSYRIARMGLAAKDFEMRISIDPPDFPSSDVDIYYVDEPNTSTMASTESRKTLEKLHQRASELMEPLVVFFNRDPSRRDNDFATFNQWRYRIRMFDHLLLEGLPGMVASLNNLDLFFSALSVEGALLGHYVEEIRFTFEHYCSDFGTTLGGFSRVFKVAAKALFDVYSPLFKDPEDLKKFVAELADDIKQGRLTSKDAPTKRQLAGLFAGKIQQMGLAFKIPAEAVFKAFGETPPRLVKVIVLDADFTLWGEAVSEVGSEGVKITEEHLAIQRKALELKKQGVLLAISSRNHPADVEAVLARRPEMLLKRSDIIMIRADDRNKSEHLKEIADELHVGLDSLVFLDDSSIERAMVRDALPEVSIPELPQAVADWPAVIDQFVTITDGAVTMESQDRTRLYQDEKERDRLRQGVKSIDEHLRALEMTVDIFEEQAGSSRIDRIVELFERTNRFNMTGRRYTRQEILERLSGAKGNYRVFSLQLKDKVGDYGIVAAIVIDSSGAQPVIEGFCLSCRAWLGGLGIRVENLFIAYVLGKLGPVIGFYVPTEKNGAVKAIYAGMGEGLSVIPHGDGEGILFDPWRAKINVPDWFHMSEEIRSVMAPVISASAMSQAALPITTPGESEKRSEVRGNLVEATLRLSDYLAPDEAINEVIIVSDNSGTLVRDRHDPVEGAMLQTVVDSIQQDGSFFLLNSGDPYDDIRTVSHAPVLRALSTEAQSRFSVISDGGKYSVGFNTEGGISYERKTPDWPVAERIQIARTLLNSLFETLKQKKGKLQELLNETPAAQIEAERQNALMRLEEVEKSGLWGTTTGAEKEYQFSLFSGSMKEILGNISLYDVGSKVTLEMKDAPQTFSLEFVQAIEELTQMRMSPSEQAPRYVASGDMFVDVTRTTKAMAVELFLREHILPRLDSAKTALIFMLGDGGNDIPTFHLKFPDYPKVLVIPIFLDHNSNYAGILPADTWVSKDEKLDGALNILRYIRSLKGQSASAAEELDLLKWHTQRSEVRTQADADFEAVLKAVETKVARIERGYLESKGQHLMELRYFSRELGFVEKELREGMRNHEDFSQGALSRSRTKLLAKISWLKSKLLEAKLDMSLEYLLGLAVAGTSLGFWAIDSLGVSGQSFAPLVMGISLVGHAFIFSGIFQWFDDVWEQRRLEGDKDNKLRSRSEVRTSDSVERLASSVHPVAAAETVRSEMRTSIKVEEERAPHQDNVFYELRGETDLPLNLILEEVAFAEGRAVAEIYFVNVAGALRKEEWPRVHLVPYNRVRVQFLPKAERQYRLPDEKELDKLKETAVKKIIGILQELPASTNYLDEVTSSKTAYGVLLQSARRLTIEGQFSEAALHLAETLAQFNEQGRPAYSIKKVDEVLSLMTELQNLQKRIAGIKALRTQYRKVAVVETERTGLSLLQPQIQRAFPDAHILTAKTLAEMAPAAKVDLDMVILDAKMGRQDIQALLAEIDIRTPVVILGDSPQNSAAEMVHELRENTGRPVFNVLDRSPESLAPIFAALELHAPKPVSPKSKIRRSEVRAKNSVERVASSVQGQWLDVGRSSSVVQPADSGDPRRSEVRTDIVSAANAGVGDSADTIDFTDYAKRLNRDIHLLRGRETDLSSDGKTFYAAVSQQLAETDDPLNVLNGALRFGLYLPYPLAPGSGRQVPPGLQNDGALEGLNPTDRDFVIMGDLFREFWEGHEAMQKFGFLGPYLILTVGGSFAETAKFSKAVERALALIAGADPFEKLLAYWVWILSISYHAGFFTGHLEYDSPAAGARLRAYDQEILTAVLREFEKQLIILENQPDFRARVESRGYSWDAFEHLMDWGLALGSRPLNFLVGLKAQRYLLDALDHDSYIDLTYPPNQTVTGFLTGYDVKPDGIDFEFPKTPLLAPFAPDEFITDVQQERLRGRLLRALAIRDQDWRAMNLFVPRNIQMSSLGLYLFHCQYDKKMRLSDLLVDTNPYPDRLLGAARRDVLGKVRLHEGNYSFVETVSAAAVRFGAITGQMPLEAFDYTHAFSTRPHRSAVWTGETRLLYPNVTAAEVSEWFGQKIGYGGVNVQDGIVTPQAFDRSEFNFENNPWKLEYGARPDWVEKELLPAIDKILRDDLLAEKELALRIMAKHNLAKGLLPKTWADMPVVPEILFPMSKALKLSPEMDGGNSRITFNLIPGEREGSYEPVLIKTGNDLEFEAKMVALFDRGGLKVFLGVVNLPGNSKGIVYRIIPATALGFGDPLMLGFVADLLSFSGMPRSLKTRFNREVPFDLANLAGLATFPTDTIIDTYNRTYEEEKARAAASDTVPVENRSEARVEANEIRLLQPVQGDLKISVATELKRSSLVNALRFPGVEHSDFESARSVLDFFGETPNENPKADILFVEHITGELGAFELVAELRRRGFRLPIIINSANFYGLEKGPDALIRRRINRKNEIYYKLTDKGIEILGPNTLFLAKGIFPDYGPKNYGGLVRRLKKGKTLKAANTAAPANRLLDEVNARIEKMEFSDKAKQFLQGEITSEDLPLAYFEHLRIWLSGFIKIEKEFRKILSMEPADETQIQDLIVLALRLEELSQLKDGDLQRMLGEHLEVIRRHPWLYELTLPFHSKQKEIGRIRRARSKSSIPVDQMQNAYGHFKNVSRGINVEDNSHQGELIKTLNEMKRAYLERKAKDNALPKMKFLIVGAGSGMIIYDLNMLYGDVFDFYPVNKEPIQASVEEFEDNIWRSRFQKGARYPYPNGISMTEDEARASARDFQNKFQNQVLTADIQEGLNFPEQSFDGILISAQVLTYLKYKMEVVSFVKGLLKKDGWGFITDFDDMSIKWPNFQSTGGIISTDRLVKDGVMDTNGLVEELFETVNAKDGLPDSEHQYQFGLHYAGGRNWIGSLIIHNTHPEKPFDEKLKLSQLITIDEGPLLPPRYKTIYQYKGARSEVRTEGSVHRSPSTEPSRSEAQDAVIFADGSGHGEEEHLENWVADLVMLAKKNRRRTIVVYNSLNKENFTESKAVQLLKSFDVPNIHIVSESLSQALKPFQFRENSHLIHYSGTEIEAVLIQSALPVWITKKLTCFVGEPGALGHGLKHLEAVKLKEQEAAQLNQSIALFVAPGIEYHHGNYVVSPVASAEMLFVQKAQFAMAFAQAA